MVDVSSFLTRWLYMCNLARDVADIQTLPYTPPHHYHHAEHVPPSHHHHSHPPPPGTAVPASTTSVTSAHSHGQAAPLSVATTTPELQSQHRHHLEEEWRQQCLRGILAYPSGMQRLYAIDALRFELVQKLAQKLQMSDDTLQQFSVSCARQRRRDEEAATLTSNEGHQEVEDEDEDPYLDTDVEIVRAFEEATRVTDEEEEETASGGESSEEPRHDDDAVLVISKNGTDVRSSRDEEPVDSVEEIIPSADQVEEAHRTSIAFREYLPQLVSSVLKSPPAFQPHLIDPIHKLKHLILQKCLKDPNWGIELCWLLEADVGRGWKLLFEHRQQTGKRLIVVLPAEKAAVIAKIGTEKREAFDLLQDAEQATAYGYLNPMHFHHHGMPDENIDYMGLPTPPRLPSSLSLRRCSHFGDTMHFIDRLTQISMELRRIPDVQRSSWLEGCLCEMNRRLRRRMVTRGDVSLDVEDNRGPYDWPQLSDISADVLKHSVHFPMIPKRGTWPNGEESISFGDMTEKSKGGVMRVLNIVTSECRILASRERCPYLVHLEVAETGVEGSDARLYASGAQGLGTTLAESLGMHNDGKGDEKPEAASDPHLSYRIPTELLRTSIHAPRNAKASKAHTEAKNMNTEFLSVDTEESIANPQSGETNLFRGGHQSDEGIYYPPDSPDYLYSNPYDVVRQHEYERLHQELQPHPGYQSAPTHYQRAPVTTGDALLEKVYGLPWDDKCAQIRQTSPFGKVKGWRLASFIMKAGEDIRREALVMQIISKLKEWFQGDIPESHRPYLCPYTIMCVGGDAGLIECLSDAKSIDEVKKETDGFTTLRDYFERAYGPPKAAQPNFHNPSVPDQPQERINFEQAQDNFLRSLVGYSLVCYILQIKDRHNANILLNREGHIMHIDFGFVLGDTPKMAKVPIFNERAPFKLSAEFWEVLGGWNFHEGGLGVRFCKMFERAFASAAAHVDEIVSLTEAAMLNLSRNPDTARALGHGIRSRLRMRGQPNSVEQKMFIMDLVNTALNSWGTSTYDWLQKSMNGYQ